ncbi:alpha/beta hydrolase [Streptomyces pathocidini]|uniref:alpha/beta fold hydrolase n=1 Tax=Streptomyces pathocidini TaxID=1650571 RepID=UPI0033DB29FB
MPQHNSDGMPAALICVSGWLCDPETLYRPLLDRLRLASAPVVQPWAVERFRGRLGQYRLTDELAAIEASAARLRAERIDLVAFSAGCTGALLFALHHPARVRSLALMEPAWLGNNSGMPGDDQFLQAMDCLARLPSGRILTAFQKATSTVPLRRSGTVLPYSSLTERCLEGRDSWRIWRRSDLWWGDLRKVTAPVYLPVGEYSTARAHVVATTLADALSCAEVETVRGCQHLDLLDAGADILAAGLIRTWQAARGIEDRSADIPTNAQRPAQQCPGPDEFGPGEDNFGKGPGQSWTGH